MVARSEVYGMKLIYDPDKESWSKENGEPLTMLDRKSLVHSAIAEAIGTASMLWSETPKGVFKSDRAADLSEEKTLEVCGFLNDDDNPHLGRATTRQLLDEIAERIDDLEHRNIDEE